MLKTHFPHCWLTLKQKRKKCYGTREKLNAAANACAFVLGNVDAMAYDSAEDIYARALQAKGIDTSKYPKESYKAMVDVLQKQRFDVTHANDEAIKKFSVSSEKLLNT